MYYNPTGVTEAEITAAIGTTDELTEHVTPEVRRAWMEWDTARFMSGDNGPVAVRAGFARGPFRLVADPFRPLWEFPAELRGAVLRSRNVIRRREARPVRWRTKGGTIRVVDGQKVFTGECLMCGGSYEEKRPEGQRRRWPLYCTGCKVERERQRKRDWAAKQRAAVQKAA